MPWLCGMITVTGPLPKLIVGCKKGMELIARPARDGIFMYWVRSLVGELLAKAPGEVDETDAPAVIVVNSSGEERVLQHPGTFRQARAARRRFEAQRQEIGDAAFCRAHGLPEHFAE